MSFLAYLPEYREDALMALDVAEREARHLAYTTHTLFSQEIDLGWVENKRMGWVKDDDGHLEKPVIPAQAGIQGHRVRTFWTPACAGVTGVRSSVRLTVHSNQVHEYMTDASLFLEALLASRPASEMLQEVVANVRGHAHKLNISTKTTQPQ